MMRRGVDLRGVGGDRPVRTIKTRCMKFSEKLIKVAYFKKENTRYSNPPLFIMRMSRAQSCESFFCFFFNLLGKCISAS